MTTTASGLGFAGGGDGVLRAFDVKTGQGALDVPDRAPDRRRAVGLLGQRQGVRRDHGRRNADVVERRHRERSSRSSRSAAPEQQSPPPTLPAHACDRTRSSRRAPASAPKPARTRLRSTARPRSASGRIVDPSRPRRPAVAGELVERRSTVDGPRAPERRAGGGRAASSSTATPVPQRDRRRTAASPTDVDITIAAPARRARQRARGRDRARPRRSAQASRAR